VQLGITMTSLGLGWVGEPAVAGLLNRLLPRLWPGAATAVGYSVSFTVAFLLITAVHILFGELVPKLVAIARPERGALLTILPLTGLYYVSYAPMLGLRKAASAVARLFGGASEMGEEVLSEEEIKIILEQREEEGGMSLQELLIFENLFDFGRSRARQAMTPRHAVAYLSAARTWQENLAVMKQRKASRYPVCREDLDSVEGYVHVKDLAFEYMSGEREPELLVIRRPILRVRDNLPLAECLRRFQVEQVSLAVVTDRAGRVAGLLSAEDIVEEIVGEIRDEFDRRPPLRLTDAFATEACDLELPATGDPFEAIRLALQHLHVARPQFDPDDALEELIARERGLSSALGFGAAFPHARVRGLERPLFSFCRSREPVAFSAPDTVPVRLLFLILTPYHEPTWQLTLLSKLARIVSNASLRDRLLEAAGLEDVAEVIRVFEESVPL
ncbi:MAG: PTS sugar transporter subunit IIA, partial [Spirochaetales bacterium]|nr:PTS sugar transporter subunit IIA [Spirochaetales bacterium]